VNVLVREPIACEPPGAVGDVLLQHGARIAGLELDEGSRCPDR
jgi:hypothetical protein